MSYPAASGPSLIVRHTGQVFPLTQAPVTIGRQADNTIALADPQVSRHHATLFWQGGAWFIQDLGSANGTYVNERRIGQPEPLRHGYVVRVGNTLFDVHLPPTADVTLQAPLAAAVPPAYPPPAAAAPAAYPPAATPTRPSVLPWIVGLLGLMAALAAVVVLFLLIRSSLRGKPPAVVIQSPLPSAQVAVGSEILLQAAASGASDITRLELSVDNFPVAVVTSPDPKGMPSLTASQPWTFGQAGPHTVSAVAYTTRGQVSQPASVALIVMEAVGQVTPSAPPPTAPPPTEPPPTAPPPTAPPPTAPPPTAPPPTAPPPTNTPTATPTFTPTPTRTPTPTPTPTQTPLPVIQFWADSLNIPAGGCTTLRVHIEHVQAAYLSGAEYSNTGVTGPDWSGPTCPASTTTYTLHVTKIGGGAEDRTITINVTPVGPVTVTVRVRFREVYWEHLPVAEKCPAGSCNMFLRVTVNGLPMKELPGPYPDSYFPGVTDGVTSFFNWQTDPFAMSSDQPLHVEVQALINRTHDSPPYAPFLAGTATVTWDPVTVGEGSHELWGTGSYDCRFRINLVEVSIEP